MPFQHRKKEFIELDITALAFGGRGIARENEFVWFVDGGIPGQRVRARIFHVRKQYGEARAIETIRPSADQVDPFCPHFGVCGGCQIQHLRYEAQIEAKTRQVAEILERLGGFLHVGVRPTLPAPLTRGYRNKMEFTFSDKRWLPEGTPANGGGEFALGLHVPGRFDKVLDLTACPLQSNRANAVFALTRDLVRNTGLPAYGPRTHQGVWRFLVLREGTATGDLMVHCITSGQALERTAKSVDHISKSLLHAHPDITTVVHSVSDRLAQVAFGESERVLHGSGCIRDRLGNRTFEISSGAFFQTNTSQAERLFQAVADAAELEGNERVYDLYCGTGAIGIFLAGRVAEVVGIEAIETAVADARRNAALNGLTNAEFITGDLKDALEDASFRSVFGPPDIVVLDPPRGGTHPDTIREILRLKPPKIVYVSCNPPILARDARTLADAGYRLGTVQPVDMFPHTGHVEVVAVLHSA